MGGCGKSKTELGVACGVVGMEFLPRPAADMPMNQDGDLPQHSSPQISAGDVEDDTTSIEPEEADIDVDTCRICRSEGSTDEPLFYPCKCSGSIRYVHQECLMEWLSHSQKKHCELCKTPFRFTKLYSPNMPETLPATIFLRRAIVHVYREIVSWCRALLVASVWLFWLPWSMRFVCWGLFWLADGGWTEDISSVHHQHLRTVQSSTNATATISMTSIPEHGPTTLFSFARLQSRLKLIQSILAATDNALGGDFLAPSTNNTVTDEASLYYGDSLLYAVPFFRHLTPSPAINKFVTDILEGQIITLAVVVAFILVFLIREWVVQQQPGLQLADAPPPAAVHGNVQQEEILAAEPVEALPNDGHVIEEEYARAIRNLTASIGIFDARTMDHEELARHVDGLIDHARDFLEGCAVMDNATPENQRMALRVLWERISMAEQMLQGTQPLRRFKLYDLRLQAEQKMPGLFQNRDSSDSAHNGVLGRSEQLVESDSEQESETGFTSPSNPSQNVEAGLELAEVNSDYGSAVEEAHFEWPTEGTIDITAPDSPAQDVESEPEETTTTTNLVTTIDNDRLQEDTPDVDEMERSKVDAQETPEVDAGSWRGRIMNWVFADVADVEEPLENVDDDPQIGEHIDEEILPVHHEEPLPVQEDGPLRIEAPVVAEPVEERPGENVNEDQDAIEEAEDLEGILELVGMQGPLVGLFQNAVFCAVLISATVATAVWLPYLWGKVVIVCLAHPIQIIINAPAILLTWTCNFVLDISLYLGCTSLVVVDSMARNLLLPLGFLWSPLSELANHSAIGAAMQDVSNGALVRLHDLLLASTELPTSEFYHLSLSSHAALDSLTLQAKAMLSQCSGILASTVDEVVKIQDTESALEGLLTLGISVTNLISNGPHSLAVAFTKLPSYLAPESFNTDIALSLQADTNLTSHLYWSATDRLVAVSAGYLAFAISGALYVKAGPPLTSWPQVRRAEEVVSELLQQAGGVLKVILIISIEMLVFPLYCGFLLDLAVLPLFDATVFSRIQFTLSSPWASCFLHWFLGTCYMFHFALFVSMCRKLLRGGVLYFIRDPDDPNFHPVRDVLERNIATQLRKIGFSAMVYGGLVLICMGSVVWTTAYSISGLFPVHWVSSMPLLEFPLDLMLYHTLTPAMVHLLQPASLLEGLYRWCFHKCGHALRVSHFLFGLDTAEEQGRSGVEEDSTVDGKWVRVPASDQVRIPKGGMVFVEVDKDNNRLDGKEDPDKCICLHGKANENFQKVFIPSWFRLRIGIFVLCLWALTAVSGLGITVLPLLFGRAMLLTFLGQNAHYNDIHAFSIGVVSFASIFYVYQSRGKVIEYVKEHTTSYSRTLASLFDATKAAVSRSVAVIYTTSALVLLVPSLMALVMEFYLILPLHAYTQLQYQSQAQSSASSITANTTIIDTMSTTLNSVIPTSNITSTFTQNNTTSITAAHVHTIHILQSWTLGILYTRILIRILTTRYPESRVTRALESVVAQGWTHPNTRIVTRVFVLPITLLTAVLLAFPAGLGFSARWIASTLSSASASSTDTIASSLLDILIRRIAAASTENAIRFSYPTVLAVVLTVLGAVALARALTRWRRKIRDEVYLVGEKLHNYGESARARARERARRKADQGKGKAVDVLREGAVGGEVEVGPGASNVRRPVDSGFTASSGGTALQVGAAEAKV